MSKEKKDKSEDKADNLIESLNKKFGNVIGDANCILNSDNKVIPVSPRIDFGLGGGIPEGSFVILAGPPKCGKGQKLTAKIYTPNGFELMKDIAVGDIVSTPNNGTANVIAIHPQGLKDIYRVTFKDGDYTDCDENHLWLVKSRDRKNKQVLPVTSLMNNIQAGDRLRWEVDLAEVYFTRKEVPLDPYILGLLLGDGSFRGKTITFTNVDEELISSMRSSLTPGYALTNSNGQISYRISKQSNPTNKYKKIIKELGLANTTSHTKFIPTCYKYNSRDIRLALIQGLMDTDGGTCKRGLHLEYTSTSLQMANDFKEIVQSLGGICRITPRTTKCNEKEFLSYRCQISYNKGKELFRLTRKKDLAQNRNKKPLKRRIAKIEKIGQEQTQCITLDSPEGLYVTDNLIVTHNSLTSLDFAASAQQVPRTNGQPRLVVYLNVEGRIKSRDLLGIPGLITTPDRFIVVESKEGNILNAEKFLEIGEVFLLEYPGCVLIVDSFSLLSTAAEMTSDMDKMQRADGAKLLAKFCRRVAQIIPVNKNIVIGINHIMGNPGMGNPTQEKGGYATAYQVDVKLIAKWFEFVKPTDDAAPIGQIVHWEVKSSALGPPGQKVDSYIRFGEGIDKAMEIVTLAIDFGIIKKAGSWLSFGDVKFQGMEKMRAAVLADKELYTKLHLQLKEFIGA